MVLFIVSSECDYTKFLLAARKHGLDVGVVLDFHAVLLVKLDELVDVGTILECLLDGGVT
jgi:hypothetical protein